MADKPKTHHLKVVGGKIEGPIPAKFTEEQNERLKNFRSLAQIIGNGISQTIRLNVPELLGLIEAVVQEPINSNQVERLGKGLIALGAIQAKGKAQDDDPSEVMAKLDLIIKKLERHPNQPVSPDVEWVSVEDFSRLIDRSTWTIAEKYCKAGKVRCRKVDPMNPRSAWRILKSEAKRFKEEGFHDVVQEHET